MAETERQRRSIRCVTGSPNRPPKIDRQQAIIDRQADEIERLHRRLDDESLARDLREAVRLSVTAGAIAAPRSPTRGCWT